MASSSYDVGSTCVRLRQISIDKLLKIAPKTTGQCSDALPKDECGYGNRGHCDAPEACPRCSEWDQSTTSSFRMNGYLVSRRSMSGNIERWSELATKVLGIYCKDIVKIL